MTNDCDEVLMPYAIEYKFSGGDPHRYWVKRAFNSCEEAVDNLSQFVRNVMMASDKGPGMELTIMWVDNFDNRPIDVED